ncbi:MAG: hypothetical protein H6Q18_1113 [Bacteroidetes bacterium]|nr:hypothetical protein [Bacteroidota bacterium]
MFIDLFGKLYIYIYIFTAICIINHLNSLFMKKKFFALFMLFFLTTASIMAETYDFYIKCKNGKEVTGMVFGTSFKDACNT